VTLGVIAAALFGSLVAGTKWSDASLTPKLALDLEYVRRRSLGLDLAIIGRTASLVLSRILRRPVRS